MIDLIYAQRLEIGKIIRRHGSRELEHGYPFFARFVDQLVVDVGDVDDPSHFITAVNEESLNRVKNDRPDHVANMRFCIDRRAAKIHAYFAWLDRLKNVFALRERVVNSNRVGSHGVAVAVEKGRKGQGNLILANLEQSWMVGKWELTFGLNGP